MKLHISSLRAVALTLVASSLMNAFPALAAEPFSLRDIRVEGLQRVEPGTVFGSLPFRIGETYSDEKVRAAIRALFSLGLFKDVRIDISGDVVVVVVKSAPRFLTSLSQVSKSLTMKFCARRCVMSG